MLDKPKPSPELFRRKKPPTLPLRKSIAAPTPTVIPESLRGQRIWRAFLQELEREIAKYGHDFGNLDDYHEGKPNKYVIYISRLIDDGKRVIIFKVQITLNPGDQNNVKVLKGDLDTSNGYAFSDIIPYYIQQGWIEDSGDFSQNVERVKQYASNLRVKLLRELLSGDRVKYMNVSNCTKYYGSNSEDYTEEYVVKGEKVWLKMKTHTSFKFTIRPEELQCFNWYIDGIMQAVGEIERSDYSELELWERELLGIRESGSPEPVR